ncbi:hypothetical protein DOT_2645 [Desulfosporosinus sp. OT]|nr:hypothetical protein DOT_2645 [Desulfosporosinus sp. OT]
MTKTHFAELFNNTIYGIVTAHAIAAFSEPSMYPDVPNKTAAQSLKKDTVSAIYSDVNFEEENAVLM